MRAFLFSNILCADGYTHQMVLYPKERSECSCEYISVRKGGAKMNESINSAGALDLVDKHENVAPIPENVRRDQDKLLDIIDTIVPEWLDDEGRVISIYGGGGQGKSTYLVKLWPRLRDRLKDSVVLRVNLEARRLDSPDAILFEIASCLNDEGISIPRFLEAYYTSLYLKDSSAAYKRYLADFYAFSDKGMDSLRSFVKSIAEISVATATTAATAAAAVAAAVNPIVGITAPVVDAASPIVGKLSKAGAEVLAKESWKNIVVAFEGGVEISDLSVALSKDIEKWTTYNASRSVVVIVDTLERLFWDIASKENRYDSRGASWFEPLTKAKGSLWIVAGRTEVSWSNLIQLPVLFDSLSEEEAIRYLLDEKVDDVEDIKRIVRISGCIPLYLKLCASYVKANGPGTSQDLDGMDRSELVSRYYRYLPSGVHDALTAAAFLVEWTDDDLWHFVQGVVPSIADVMALHDLSFVYAGRRESEEVYLLHEVVAEALRSSCANNALTQALATTCKGWLQSIDADTSKKDLALLRKRILALEILERLAELGVEIVGGEEQRYEILMAHANSLCDLGSLDKSFDLFVSIEELYSSPDTLENRRRRSQARLKQAKVNTDKYLLTDDAHFFEQTIAVERMACVNAYEQELGDFALANALNNLGLSLNRFHLYGLSEAILTRALALAESSADNIGDVHIARYANNLGTVLQGHADHCSGLEDIASSNELALREAEALGIKGMDLTLRVDFERAKELYDRALAMYQRSYRIRKVIYHSCGRRDDRAVMLTTRMNLANLLGRIGVFEEKKKLVKKARKHLEKIRCLYEEYFESDNKEYLRCLYSIAYLQEQSARLCCTDESDYRSRIAEALELHEKVLADRMRTTGGNAQVTKRSRQRVDACREELSRLDGLAAQ